MSGIRGSTAGFIQAVAAWRVLGSPIILKPIILALLSAVGASLWIFWAGTRRVWGAFALVIGLLAWDLISFGWAYTPAVPPSYIYPTTPSIEFLRKQPGPFRVVQDTGSGLYVNTLAPFGVEELGGYVNAYPERVNKLVSTIEYGSSALRMGALYDRWVMFRNHTSPLYDLMNVRYILTSPNRAVNDPKYRLVFREDLAVWENTRALPRAFAVHRAVVGKDIAGILEYMTSPSFDMSGEVVLEAPAAPARFPRTGAAADRVTITRYEPDDIDISAELDGSGWVVVSNTWYPGWRASVDGREVPLLRADASVMAIPVPDGRHAVTLRYRPASFARGMLLTLLGLLFSIVGMIYVLVRERRGVTADGVGGDR
jgi:hypothetical protein